MRRWLYRTFSYDYVHVLSLYASHAREKRIRRYLLGKNAS